ncbi:MAG TPA: hypothetical protein VLX61_07150 [Anaerolineales bacterium]|nr:hypothetical protein [Anaerolineales bacterium]
MTRRVLFPLWTIPLSLLIIVAAAYGLFAAQGGIHWDDWAFMWIPAFLGREGLVRYFSTSRPLWGYFYVLSTSLIGTNIFGWQIFALVWRWLAAVALWWMLSLTWPRKARAVFFMSLFIALYPGFMEHSIVITYGHFSLIFTLFFLSMALMQFAERHPRYYWPVTIGAMICSSLNLFSLEYYFGLEVLRPLLLWVVVSEKTTEGKDQIRRTLLAYLPYAFVLISFILWRALGFQSQDYGIRLSSASGGLLSALGTMLVQVPGAIWASSAGAWLEIFQFPSTADFGVFLSLLYVTVLLGSFAGLIFYVPRLKHSDDPSGPRGSDRKIIGQWILIGACALITAGIPFYVVGLQVRLNFPADRFTQPFAFGTALILTGLLELIPSLSWRTTFCAALIALAIGLQIQYGFAFREDWKLQKAYFWQLFWRAPAIQPGTAILSDSSIFPFTGDVQMTLPLNWIYAPDRKSGSVLYAQTFFSKNSGGAIPLTAGSSLDRRRDVVSFHGSTDAALVVQFTPPSCLHVLNPLYDSNLPLAPLSGINYQALSTAGLPMLGRPDRIALPLSKPSLIQSSGGMPAALSDLFGPEPLHNWCYFYEKADLARQEGDWEQVAHLGDEAFAASYRPDDPSEYLPFIEAYARTDRWDDAKQLTLSTADAMPILGPALCGLWQRVDADPALSAQAHGYILKIEQRLQYCPVH